MKTYTVPFVIRGKLIEDYTIEHPTRFGGEARFVTPDPDKFISDMLPRNQQGMRDMYALSLDDVFDYLSELGRRLVFDTNPHMQAAFELIAAASPQTPSLLRHKFEQAPAMFSRKVLEEYVDTSIGRAVLDGWLPVSLADGSVLSVRAFGARTVHVIAGSGPSVSLMTVVRNALTRSSALIKLPSNDPMTAVAIARTMVDMDPHHPLTKNLSVAYWKGGDTALEDQIYDPLRIDKIVAWGGGASMKSITRYIQPGIDLVAFDPKLSSSIIGKAAFLDEKTMREVAQRAASDIGSYNQIGCASARVVFVETGTDPAGLKLAEEFGAYIYEALQALPGDISTPAKVFDANLRQEIQGIRLASGLYSVIGGASGEGAIIVSLMDEPVDFSDKLADRVANTVPVESLDRAIGLITHFTQTIGIYPEALKTRLRDEAPFPGAQRLVSLGYANAPPLTGPWDAMEPLRRHCRWIMDQTCDPAVVPGLWRSGVYAGFGASFVI